MSEKTPTKEKDIDFSDMASISTRDHLVIKDDETGEVLVNQATTVKSIKEEEKTVQIQGFVTLRDPDTGEVLVDTHNDVHRENMGEAMALALARFDNGFIEEMCFGNGGTVIGLTGQLDYNLPNIVGSNVDLYNETFVKVVNDRSPYFISDARRTNIAVEHSTGSTISDIIITCYLGRNEPSDAAPYDDMNVVDPINSLNPYSRYIFNEIGLKTNDRTTGIRRLLTHVIFHPVQKSLNRAIEIIYRLRIEIIQP